MKDLSVDRIYSDDIINFYEDNKRIINEMSGTTVFITGANGFIGSFIVRSFMYWNRNNDLKIKVYASVHNIEKAEKIFSEYLEDESLIIREENIEELKNIPEETDYIFHCAANTQSVSFVERPVETINTAYYGVRNILELSKQSKVKSIVYLSSLEVYGRIENGENGVLESDSGYIDVNNVRSSYSEGKRLCECLCVSYFHEYNVPVKIARLTQTFGSGMNYDDNRVCVQFSRSVVEEKNIVLHTKGDTIRNYCYLTDAVSAILYIALYGKNGEAYNVANKNTAISIRDMAKMVSEEFSDKVKVVFDIEKEAKFGYNPVIKINLNTDKLESIGWKAKVDLKEMYYRTIESLKIRRRTKDE